MYFTSQSSVNIWYITVQSFLFISPNLGPIVYSVLHICFVNLVHLFCKCFVLGC